MKEPIEDQNSGQKIDFSYSKIDGKMTKKKCNEVHFVKRCVERIGYVLDDKDIINKIQHNGLEFIKKESNTRTMFRYIDPNSQKSYRVIYDKLRHNLVTVLPDYKKRKDSKHG